MNLSAALARRDLDWIVPDWPAPPNVRALMTTRNAEVEAGVRRSMNLGRAEGDADAARIERNRQFLREVCGVEPVWLSQTHSTDAIVIDSGAQYLNADGAVATRPGRAATVRIADCLPVLLTTRDGSRVAAAHAGWRGLADGIIERTIDCMDARGPDLIAWLGAAIGPTAFEVGSDVVERFVTRDHDAEAAFSPYPGRPGKWLADLYALARMRLGNAGVASIHGGDLCTYRDPSRFFSWRRDKTTERMAALIWIGSDDAIDTQLSRG